MTTLEYIEDAREKCIASLELVTELCERKAAQNRGAKNEEKWAARARFYKRQARALRRGGQN